MRPCVVSGVLAASALVAMVLLQAGARGASTSLVGEFNMAGPAPRDFPWVDGLVVNHRVNTPLWPIYHKTSPWPPQQMTVEQLYNALHESREYQAGSWVKDPSSLTGYSQALDPAKVPFLLDCREEGEYRRARIADATNIPLSQLQARLDEIPRDRPLFVIGQSGKSPLALTHAHSQTHSQTRARSLSFLPLSLALARSLAR
jgi:hypothetical protein